MLKNGIRLLINSTAITAGVLTGMVVFEAGTRKLRSYIKNADK